MATVHIPPQLRDVTDGVASVEVNGSNLRAVIAELEVRFPGIESRIVRDGTVMPGLAFSIDHVVTSLGLLARVEENSVIHFVPGIAGG